MSSAIAETVAKSSGCCPSGKTMVILASLVIAVAGLAYSILQGSMLGIFGFLAQGAMTLYFYCQDNREIQQFEGEVADVANEQVAKMNALNAQLKGQVDELTKNRLQEQGQLGQLQADVNARQGLQQKLEADNARMMQEIDALMQSKAALDKDLSQMKENAKLIQAQAKALLEQNLRLGQATSAFGNEVGNLDHHRVAMEAELKNFGRDFDGDLGKLSQQLELGKKVSQDLMARVGEQIVGMEESLHAAVANAEETEKQLKAGAEQFNHLQQEISAQMEALAKREAQKANMEKEIQVLEDVIKRQVAIVERYNTIIAQKKAAK